MPVTFNFPYNVWEYRNRDSKIHLYKWKGQNVSFSCPSNWENCCSVFHIAIDTGDVAEKIQTSNPVKETG